MSLPSDSRGVKVDGSLNQGVIVTGDHNAVTLHVYGNSHPSINVTVTAFINYRCGDSQHICVRIHDSLRQLAGVNCVFKDVARGDTPPRVSNDSRLLIEETIGSCQVLIVVIGRLWLTLADESGRRLIDDENDFVRIEIETAIKRGVRVVLVLVEGALPPRPADLPGSLEGLTSAQSVLIRADPEFRTDVDRLIALVHQEAGSQRGTVPLVEQAAAIYELLHYEVERAKVISGRTIDLFLTGKHGDLDVHRVIGCFPNPVGSDDLHRFCDLLRVVKREYRQARGTIITARSVSVDVAVLANLDDVNIRTVLELSTKLLDGRTYATGLRMRCGETELYPTQLYVVPMIAETVQGDERPAFTGLLSPAATGVSLRNDTQGVIERWLADPKANQMTLLGDVGTGKTFLMRVLASELSRRYLEKPASEPMPLLIDLRDTDRDVSLEGLVLTHLQSQGLRQITFPIFEHAVRNGHIILLFDGFDEMAARTSPQVTRRNFQQLARCAKGKGKLLITCRTHYFTSRTEEEEVVLGSTLESSSPMAHELLRDLIDGHNCHIAYLRPFKLPQIREYVERARPKDAAACLKKIEGVYNLPELCQRPMLLQMIVKSIDRLGSREINPSRLYEVFTEVWINRDTWRAILTRDLKLQFVTALARVFWHDGVSRIHYRSLLGHVKSEFAADIQDPRRLVEIDSEVRTATFLIRDEQGHYGFAHKSYSEYFLARDLSTRLNRGEIDCLRTKPLTLEVLTFLNDLLDVERVETLLEAQLTGEYVPLVSENCLLTLYGLRRQNLLSESREMGCQQGDLIVALPDRVLLPNAKLSSVNLEGAVLRSAIMVGADLSSSSLMHCDMTGASLTGSNLELCNLSHATISYTDFSRANLRNSIWLGVRSIEGFRSDGADWTDAKVPREFASHVSFSPMIFKTDSLYAHVDLQWLEQLRRTCEHQARLLRHHGCQILEAGDLVSLAWIKLSQLGLPLDFTNMRVQMVVRSVCMDAYNRARLLRQREIPESMMHYLLDDLPDRFETDPDQFVVAREQVVSLLKYLPHLEREIIIMRYLHEEPSESIAMRLGCSLSLLRQRINRALTLLREAANPSTV